MQPHIIEDSITVPSAGFANVIAQNNSLLPLIVLPFPAKLRLIAVQSATGLTLDLFHSQMQVASACVPRIATAFDDPLDVIADDAFAGEGEQLVLRANNSSGGNLTLRYKIEAIPLVGEEWTPGQPFDLGPYPDTLTMRSSVSIAAAAVDQQLLNGLQFERLPWPSILEVLMTQSAIGLLRQIYIDQTRVSPPAAFSIANRSPQDPFDRTAGEIECAPNAKQQLQVSNPTVGALTVFWATRNRLLQRV